MEIFSEANEVTMVKLAFRIRKKAKLVKLENVIRYEFSEKEFIVLDLLMKEYKEICKDNNYLVKVVYK
jgi:hypothetical protein